MLVRIKTIEELRETPGVSYNGDNFHHAKTECYFNSDMVRDLPGKTLSMERSAPGSGGETKYYSREADLWVFYPWMFHVLPTNQGDD